MSAPSPTHDCKRISELAANAFDEIHFPPHGRTRPVGGRQMLALAPPVASFLSHAFSDTPVAVQSLTFDCGSDC